MSTSGFLYVDPRVRAVSNTGQIQPNMTKTFYLSGTTTLATIYGNVGLSTTITNPQVADASGRFRAIYLDPANSYRVVTRNSLGVTLEDNDPGAGPSPVDPATVGPALWPATAAELAEGITITNYNYEPGDVKRYGALGNGDDDDTIALQAAIDFVSSSAAEGQKYLKFSPGVYPVSQLTFGNGGSGNGATGVTYEFQGSQLLGKLTGTYSSVVEIMCSYCTFLNMAVNANFNPDYECAVHWYSNNLTTNYPGYNRLYNLYITQARLGLCVGMLPSQGGTYYSTNVAKPLARDAPVSESFVHGMQTTYCVEGCRVHQPNGKLTFTDCHIAGDDTGQLSLAANTSALNVLWGEVAMMGGSLELISETAGLFGTFGTTFGTDTGAVNINLIGVVMESVRPIYITGQTAFRLSNNMDWGTNGDTSFFWIDETAIGELIISDASLFREYTITYSTPVIKTVSNLAGSAGYATMFAVKFTNTEFRNSDFMQSTGAYLPLVYGCKSTFEDCLLSVYDASSVRTSAYRINPSTNLLAGKIDGAGKTVTAYGVNATATVGGITFTVPAGAPSWGVYTVGLPSYQGVSSYGSIRLTAVGGGLSLTALTAKFPVEPFKAYILSGYIKTGATANPVTIKAKWYDFGGAASTTATSTLFAGEESQFGATWQPFHLWVTSPSDATQCSLELYAENTADIQVLGLTIG